MEIINALAISPLVPTALRDAWETYASEHQDWIKQSLKVYFGIDRDGFVHASPIAPTIYNALSPTTLQPQLHPPASPYFAPLWQTSPPPVKTNRINQNMFSYPELYGLYQDLMMTIETANATKVASVVSPILADSPEIYGFGIMSTTTTTSTTTNNDEDGDSNRALIRNNQGPKSVLMMPIYDSLVGDATRGVVALLHVIVDWENYLKWILPQDTMGTVVLKNDCGQQFVYDVSMGVHNNNSTASATVVASEMDRGLPSFQLPTLTYLGDENPAGTSGNTWILEHVLSTGTVGAAADRSSCSYTIEYHVQAILQESMLASRNNNLPEDGIENDDDDNIRGLLILALVPLIFAIIGLIWMYFVFQELSERVAIRHDSMVKAAARSSAIVSSMFPSNIRARLYAENDLLDSSSESQSTRRSSMSASAATHIKKKIRGLKKKTSTSAADECAAATDSNENANAAGGAEGKTDRSNNNSTSQLECFPDGFQRAGSIRLRDYLEGGLSAYEEKNSSPIADLFLNCTVLFADIAGKSSVYLPCPSRYDCAV